MARAWRSSHSRVRASPRGCHPRAVTTATRYPARLAALTAAAAWQVTNESITNNIDVSFRRGDDERVDVDVEVEDGRVRVRVRDRRTGTETETDLDGRPFGDEIGWNARGERTTVVHHDLPGRSVTYYFDHYSGTLVANQKQGFWREGGSAGHYVDDRRHGPWHVEFKAVWFGWAEGSYEKGKRITGLAEAADVPDVTVFHAGTALRGDDVVTSGGRVLSVTAIGQSIDEAAERAYAAADKIDFEGKQLRRDIGWRARTQ